MKNNNKVQKTTNVGNEVLTDVSKRFNTIDDANLFLNENKVPNMTVKEMLSKMSEGQIIKFAEFLYYM